MVCKYIMSVCRCIFDDFSKNGIDFCIFFDFNQCFQRTWFW